MTFGISSCTLFAMTNPTALFVDLRRQSVIESWPDTIFTIAYIVCADTHTTRCFFETYHHQLAAIPHITCEMAQPDTLPFLLAQPCLTRLSLPIDFITQPVIDSAKQIDAIIYWDHRRKPDFYHAKITAALAQSVKHLSLYGLQNFAVWQDVQTFLNAHDLFFYERFHAAAPGHESPYQNHLASFGDIIALPQHGGGWSRMTENQVTKTRGPHQLHWHRLDAQTQREERLLLGLAHRHGVSVEMISKTQRDKAIQSGLAIIKHGHMCPTDQGLWHLAELVTILS